MKTFILAAIITVSFAFTAQSVYDFKVEGIDGTPINLADYKGKKIMIVNTASKCGNTPQYDDLEKLYAQHDDKLVIIGFPVNNFGSQEPGSNEEIAAFCDKNYAITFPMMAKISVKGPDMHPLYKFLTQRTLNGYADNEVKWNFQKYLVNENGKLEKIIDEGTSPADPEVISWIED